MPALSCLPAAWHAPQPCSKKCLSLPAGRSMVLIAGVDPAADGYRTVDKVEGGGRVGFEGMRAVPTVAAEPQTAKLRHALPAC